MYLRTPKRYTRGGRRRGFSFLRRLLLWIIALVLIFIGVGIYENRDIFIPRVSEAVESVVGQAGDTIATANAPAPVPTQDPTNELMRADQAWRRGSIQEAVSLYERVVSATPNELGVHYRLALGLIMQARLDEALQAAENAVTANPFAADAWSIRAMALNRLDRYGEAVASALHALELVTEEDVEETPAMAMSRARAQAFLAEAYLNLGQADRALAVVDEAIEMYPDSFEAHQVRAMINWTGFFEVQQAREDLQIAYDLAPNMVYVAIWLARLEAAWFENDNTAVGLYQDIIERNPGNPLALLDLGEYYFRVENNFSEAESYLTRCIEADPRNAACHYLLGRTRMRLEQVLEARESFETALDLDPQGAGGYYHWWLAETYIRVGQCPQALSSLQNGYRIARENEDTDLIENFEFSLGQCGALQPAAETTPETTPEAENADL